MSMLAGERPFACGFGRMCVGKGPTLDEAEGVDERLVANERC